MPNPAKFFPAILIFAAGILFSAPAATNYTETFATGSNGWVWIRNVAGSSSFTGGVARVTMNPTGFPNPTEFVVLAGSNNVSGGSFTGNYHSANIKTIGFSFFAFNIVSNATPNTVDIQWGDRSNTFTKSFTPTQTGIWYKFEADLRCYDKGGWSVNGSVNNFTSALADVRFVQVKFYGADSTFSGGRINTYLVDDIFIDNLRNYTNSPNNQSITFASITNQVSTNVLTLSASSSSGLPVYFEVASGPAVITGCDQLSFTSTGTVSIVATQNGNTNFNQAASVTNTFEVKVPKTVAQVELQNLVQTYDGNERIVTASTTPTGLAVVITYNGSLIPPTNAGSYAVTGAIDDVTYQGSATGTLLVAKASATVNLNDLLTTYNATGQCASASTAPSGLLVNLAYDESPDCPTNAGAYTVVGTINELNYAGAATNIFTILKAPVTVSLTNLVYTYDGTGACAVASTDPEGFAVDVTYNGSMDCPTNAGTYTVVGMVNDPNFGGAATGSLVIAKATATVIIEEFLVDYYGGSQCASVYSIPPGLVLVSTYNGSSVCPSNAGSYTVVTTVSNLNYTGIATGIFVIQKASATVSLTNLVYTYDGTGKCASATTVPGGLSVDYSYNGFAACPVNAGSYQVIGSISAENYLGSTTSLLVIGKSAQGITFGALPLFVEGDSPYALPATASSGLPISFASSDPAVAAVSGGSLQILGEGSADITASQAGNSNYEAASNVVRVAVVTNLVAELSAQLAGTNIRLDVTGNTGRLYRIQYAHDGSFLVQSNWQELVTITNLPTANYQVNDPMTNGLRFYRLNRPAWLPEAL